MNSLEINNLTKRYDKFILDKISFSIPKGYIMGFIGENGAGKTTTIKSILNLVQKDSGDIKIFGLEMNYQNELEIKSRIGYVSGEMFYPKRSLKMVTDVFKRFYKSWDQSIYQKYLVKFDLDENKKIDELSRGMRLKYTIALALSHHAELLILDEPTSGLDPVARNNMLALFQTIVEDEETSILFSTHITSDLDKCADYVTYIKNGQIMESCSKDHLIDKYRLVSGSKKDLDPIKRDLISYKENPFGFIGLIETSKIDNVVGAKFGQPSLDDIMIYYANMEVGK